jgi:excisionase family DNA binding protein
MALAARPTASRTARPTAEFAVESTADAAELLPKAFYSPAEVATLASVSSSTILNYVHEGRLAAVRLSERTYRIPRKAVIRLLGIDAPAPSVTVDASRDVEP